MTRIDKTYQDAGSPEEGPGFRENHGPSRYRSSGEEQLARYFEVHKIPFLHEHPLAVVEAGKTRIWYPDFQLPSLGLVVEYAGRLRDAGYAEGWARRLSVYRGNGLDPLVVAPEDLKGYWPLELTRRIERILDERLLGFRERTKQK